MAFMELIDTLFRHGLGELPVFYRRVNGIYLGNMVYDKGHLFFKDRGVLGDTDCEQDEMLWVKNLLGMVCFKRLLKWQSLTFYGIDYCSVDGIDPELRKSLMNIKDESGERLFDFVGSIYRAYHLFVEHGFLPVVLLREVTSKSGDAGLAIGDLRSLSLPADIQERAKDAIRTAATRQALVKVSDLETTGPGS